MALKIGDYKTDVHNDWCPGCGDFGIVNSIQMALAEMEIPRHQTAIFSGIGCSGKTSHFINVFGEELVIENLRQEFTRVYYFAFPIIMQVSPIHNTSKQNVN